MFGQSQGNIIYLRLLIKIHINHWEAPWPSGRASDSGARGRGFDPHSDRRVVSLSKIPRKRWLRPDLAIRQVNVITRLYCDQNIMGRGPVCYIPKFMEIESLVPRDNVLRLFKTYGRGSHLVM